MSQPPQAGTWQSQKHLGLLTACSQVATYLGHVAPEVARGVQRRFHLIYSLPRSRGILCIKMFDSWLLNKSGQKENLHLEPGLWENRQPLWMDSKPRDGRNVDSATLWSRVQCDSGKSMQYACVYVCVCMRVSVCTCVYVCVCECMYLGMCGAEVSSPDNLLSTGQLVVPRSSLSKE